MCDDFCRFRVFHNQLVPSNVWRIAIKQSNSLESMTFLAKLSCQVKHRIPTRCTMCNMLIQDELYHIVFDCQLNELQLFRDTYMSSIESQFIKELASFLKNITRDNRLLYMLGLIDRDITVRLKSDNYCRFLNLSSVFLKTLFSYICT